MEAGEERRHPGGGGGGGGESTAEQRRPGAAPPPPPTKRSISNTQLFRPIRRSPVSSDGFSFISPCFPRPPLAPVGVQTEPWVRRLSTNLPLTQPTGWTEQRGWEAEPPGVKSRHRRPTRRESFVHLLSRVCFSSITAVAMASAALELMGFFLGLLGMLGTLVATVLPYWQISAHIGSNIVTAVANMRGLWMECVYQSTGAFQCETYNSMLALPSDLQASRALMVISLVLSVLAIALSVLGMQCTICLDSAGAVKNRVAGAGGSLFLAAGFLALIPVAWDDTRGGADLLQTQRTVQHEVRAGRVFVRRPGLCAADNAGRGDAVHFMLCERAGRRPRETARRRGIRIPWESAWRGQVYGRPRRPTATPPCRRGAPTRPAGGRRWSGAPAAARRRAATGSREPRSPRRQDMTSQDTCEVTITPSHL
ncbi:hypothetical protein L3Q82_006614 [Scortum barcoo]|uniref:Uncharacterized protein n=1 Tax=Scortum barcoo TaxID=214431 RepID=A0ACB8X0C4_9TELE|nr:hypothetical protein L3Q82_006614 [Scortum barcoo]